MKPEFVLYEIKIVFSDSTLKYLDVFDSTKDIESALIDIHSDFDVVLDVEFKPFEIEGYQISITKK